MFHETKNGNRQSRGSWIGCVFRMEELIDNRLVIALAIVESQDQGSFLR